MKTRIGAALLSAIALVAPVTARADGHTMEAVFVTSFDGTEIDVNICRPAGASAENPVPIVLTSHGWGGAKSSCLNRTTFFDAGIGFASMSQRGAGESGGESNVMDPDFEGRDILAVVDHLASLEWVKKDDGPGGVDPVLGAVGGSYGGGFQWVGAFTDQLLHGRTRFNALRPGNTWHDLRASLAPNGVMRTVIVSGLYAGGARSYDIAPWVHASMVSSLASGELLDGPDPIDFGSELHQHGSAWFVDQGLALDIPVYQQQGASDLVFNLNEGLHNFELALTDDARARSAFVNDQGGHNVPAEVPSGPLPYTPRSEGQCGTIGELAWFQHTLLGEPLDLSDGRYRLRTVDGACVLLDALPEPTAVTPIPTWTSTTGPRGLVQSREVAQGPMRLAGIPTLAFDATAIDRDARLFWGIAVGTTAEDAQLVGAQWMPTRVTMPVLEHTIVTELGGVVVDVEEGEKVFLVSSPSVDQYVAHSSRTPGVLLAENVRLRLPIVE